jgi:hypothetical protein
LYLDAEEHRKIFNLKEWCVKDGNKCYKRYYVE